MGMCVDERVSHPLNDIYAYVYVGKRLIVGTMYTSPCDLNDKIEYYMSHEKERQEIAENGRRKIRTEYDMRKKL